MTPEKPNNHMARSDSIEPSNSSLYEPDGQAHRRPKLRILGRFLAVALFSLLILMLLILFGMMIVKTLSMDQVQQARQGLQTFGAWWMFIRFGFIVVLTVYWVEISTWWARKNHWTEQHLQHVLARRWVMLGVLSFVELFLVQRIHEPLTDRLF